MIKCNHCSMVFDVTWVNAGSFIYVNCCPFCASEEIEDIKEVEE